MLKIHYKLRFTLALLLGILIFSLTATNNKALAADFDISNNFDYIFNEELTSVEITETFDIAVNNSLYILPIDYDEVFIIPDFRINGSTIEQLQTKAETISVTDQFNNKVSHTYEIKEDNSIYVSLKGSGEASSNSKFKLQLKYETDELIFKLGDVYDILIPGISDEIDLETADPQFGIGIKRNFGASISLPKKDSLDINYFSPSDANFSEIDQRYFIELTQQQLLQNNFTAQLGNQQNFKFRIEQDTIQTNYNGEGINFDDVATSITSGTNPNTNLYHISLPRNYKETDQNVLYTRFIPEPIDLKLNDEGNLQATFEVSSKTQQTIVIEGYIQLKNDPDYQKIRDDVLSIQLGAYNTKVESLSELSKYQLGDRYWETDSKLVTQTAEELLSGSLTLNDLVNSNYKFIVDTFDYSYDKLEQGNPRLGAANALEGGDCVCMEYADTLVALFRAQGVPARAAIGYGVDKTGATGSINDQTLTQQNFGHQWVQIFIPDYGWFSLDPTWGEVGRDYIGEDLDHLLWFTIGSNSDDFFGTGVTTTDAIVSNQITDYRVYLQAVTSDNLRNEQFKTEFKPISQVIQEVEIQNEAESNSMGSFVSELVGDSTVGRSIIYSTPLVMGLLVLVVGALVVMRVLKR